MVCSLELSLPAGLRFAEEKLENLEKAVKIPGFIPILSSVTGGFEVLTGTTASVYFLATAFFYKMVSYAPFMTAEQKALWANSKGLEYSLQLFFKSITTVAIGVLHSIPLLGNIANFYVYEFLDREKKWQRLDLDIQESKQDLRKLASDVHKHEQDITDLSERLAKVESNTRSLPQRFGKIRSDLRKVSVDSQEAAHFQEEISSLEDKVEQLSIMLERFHTLRSPQGIYSPV